MKPAARSLIYQLNGLKVIIVLNPQKIAHQIAISVAVVLGLSAEAKGCEIKLRAKWLCAGVSLLLQNFLMRFQKL